MSDDTPQDPHVSHHEPAAPEGWTEVPGTSATESGPRVAFCQDCGKPLTAETARAVGTGVFCEPCLAARVTAQNTAAGYTGVPPLYPATLVSGTAHPVLAGFLGLIPGVGAMYNGQYSKGFAHLIIFVLLDSIQKNVSSVFGLFVLGWICYQVFDAYHTAKARNEGLPLPNVFGLNDIGEKMGFGKTWGFGGQIPGGPAAGTQAPPPAATAWQTTPQSPQPGPVPSGPDWVGYVPPTHFTNSVSQQANAYAAAVHQQTYQDAGFSHQPHTQTVPGPSSANPYTIPPVPPVAPDGTLPRQSAMQEVVPGHRRFPVAAFWLIGLGLLILLANLLPDWRMMNAWWPVVVCAGLSVTILLRRLRSGSPVITCVRAPILLMVLAVMFALHAAGVYVNFGILAAVLCITVGGLLVIERTLGAAVSNAPADSPRASADSPRAPADASRASFVPASDYPSPTSPIATDEDIRKGGR
jgi:hypothetical protein